MFVEEYARNFYYPNNQSQSQFWIPAKTVQSSFFNPDFYCSVMCQSTFCSLLAKMNITIELFKLNSMYKLLAGIRNSDYCCDIKNLWYIHDNFLIIWKLISKKIIWYFLSTTNVLVPVDLYSITSAPNTNGCANAETWTDGITFLATTYPKFFLCRWFGWFRIKFRKKTNQTVTPKFLLSQQ